MEPLKFTEAEAEALDLRPRIHEWLNHLAVAGMDQRGALAAVLSAITERALFAFGTQHTAAWLREMASQIDKHGDAIRAGMEN